MKIGVDVKGIEAVKAHLAGLGKQVAFAASKALNATGKAVSDAMQTTVVAGAGFVRCFTAPIKFTGLR